VVTRYRRATESPANPWEGAVLELREFQKRCDEAYRLTDVNSDEAQKLLGEFAFNKNGTAPTFGNAEFLKWFRMAFVPMELDVDPIPLKPNGAAVLMVADGKAPLSKFKEAVKLYADSIQDALDKAAPARFTYSGFPVWNNYRMGDAKCRKLLEGVDYLVALFKKRGLSHLFDESVSRIELVPDLSDNTLGLYFSQSRHIVLSYSMFKQSGPGRFMEWVREVLLHEFGHHLHLSILPKEARKVWDSGWDEVKSKKEALELAFRTITRDERVRYYNALKQTSWDVARAAKKLSAVDRVKFGVWLRSPMTGDPLITDKQFRLTKQGQSIALYMTDPELFLKREYQLVPEDAEYERQNQTVAKRIADKLGLSYSGTYGIPIAIVEEMVKADPTMSKAVDEALEKLEIVSPYGKTNEKEDFAETFVAFVDAPEKLTPTAKFRMQRALAISGLYGKPVMKLADRIVRRFLGNFT